MYPRISIVMPSFNQGKYIEESIKSVLDQNYPNLEFMVLDGGSTDSSRDIIERYADKLNYWHSQPDKGQTDAIVMGLKRATGDLLGYLGSDDVLLKNSLKKIAYAFSQNPKGGFFGGDYIQIDDNGLIIRVKKHTRYAAWFGRHGLQVISPNWLFTPEAYKEVGGMKPEYEYIFDTDLFYRMASEGIKFVYINTPLIGFRYHPDSKSVSEQERFINEFRIRRSLTKNKRKSVLNRALIKSIYRVSQTLNGNIFRNILQTNRYRGVHWRAFEKEF